MQWDSIISCCKMLIGLETSKAVAASVKLQFVSRILLKTLGIVCVLHLGNDLCNYSSGRSVLYDGSEATQSFSKRSCGRLFLGQGAKVLSESTQDIYPRHHGSWRCRAAGTARWSERRWGRARREWRWRRDQKQRSKHAWIMQMTMGWTETLTWATWATLHASQQGKQSWDDDTNRQSRRETQKYESSMHDDSALASAKMLAVSRWILISPSLRSCCVTIGISWIIWCAIILWGPVNRYRIIGTLERHDNAKVHAISFGVTCLRPKVGRGWSLPKPQNTSRNERWDITSLYINSQYDLTRTADATTWKTCTVTATITMWVVHCHQHVLQRPSWSEEQDDSWYVYVSDAEWRNVQSRNFHMSLLWRSATLYEYDLVQLQHGEVEWWLDQFEGNEWTVWIKCRKTLITTLLSALSGWWLTTFRSCGCLLTRDPVNVWLFRVFNCF